MQPFDGAERRGVTSSVGAERRTNNLAGALLFTAYVVSLLLVMIPPLWAAMLVLPRGRLPDRMLRRGARAVLRLSGCKLHVRGLEHLAACEPAVLVANHSSYLDSIVLMAAVPIDYLFVVNHHAAAWPFVGRAIRAVGHLVVNRARHTERRACRVAMMEALRRGRSVLVFPEGTIHRDGVLMRFQPGAFRAAIAVGRPVVPITLRGTDEVWSKGAWKLRRGSMNVTIHEPLAAVEGGRRGILRLSELARQMMAVPLVLDSSVLVAAERAKSTTPDILQHIRASVGDVPIIICALTVAELAHGIHRAEFAGTPPTAPTVSG